MKIQKPIPYAPLHHLIHWDTQLIKSTRPERGSFPLDHEGTMTILPFTTILCCPSSTKPQSPHSIRNTMDMDMKLTLFDGQANARCSWRLTSAVSRHTVATIRMSAGLMRRRICSVGWRGLCYPSILFYFFVSSSGAKPSFSPIAQLVPPYNPQRQRRWRRLPQTRSLAS